MLWRRVIAPTAIGLLAASLVTGVPSSVAPAPAHASESAHRGPAFRAGARFDPTDSRARVRPRQYTAYTLDAAAVRAELADAPVVTGSGTRAGRPHGVTFGVPRPDGGTERFSVVRTEVMQPGLAAAHPEILTWAGTSVDHPGTSIAMDLTPMGFHASVIDRSGGAAAGWYVDPAYDRRGTTTELSYERAAVGAGPQPPEERQGATLGGAATTPPPARTSPRPGRSVVQRVYRLALTSDPTYAAYFGTQNVLAEKVTLVNRVDQIYNQDLAVWLQLVDGEDLLNLDTEAKATGPDGPCGAHACFDVGGPGTSRGTGQLDSCGASTLGRNRTVIGQLIGAGNYDVGHIVLGVDGGGLSDVGTVGADYKAGGCTGIPTPQGDLFAVDYLAHELGHEFGGTHDFAGNQLSCGGAQHAQQASVEPGSGSTVMAYAGICGSDNLQDHSDPYFSQFSQRQLSDYVDHPADPVNEVQTVSLRGFDVSGDQVTLGYPGSPATQTLTLGATYDATSIQAAVQALTGLPVVVAQWGYDPLDHLTPSLKPPGPPDQTGFQVIFAGTYDPRQYGGAGDLPLLTVTSSTPDVGGFVGETAQGGVAHNLGAAVTTANHAPRVHAPEDRTIPVRTPFRLKGHGRDPDGDQVGYSWEQNDRGSHRGTRLLDPKRVYGPLFRVFGTSSDVTSQGTLKSPSPGEHAATGEDKVRYFPDLAQVLARNTNARTGSCPSSRGRGRGGGGSRLSHGVRARTVECFSELLPTQEYVGDFNAHSPRLRFVLTARDGSPLGGGVDQARVTLRLDRDAGPFLVTSQARRGAHYPARSRMPVTWAVNGTRPLAAYVSVLLSVDRGRHWRVVRRHVANDGATSVPLPRKHTARARVMVRADGNYFFAVNDRSFSID